MDISHEVRLKRALNSLEGLSVGDAVGECFFIPLSVHGDAVGMEQSQYLQLLQDTETKIRVEYVGKRVNPRPVPWKWTDDTALALEIYTHLREHGRIIPHLLGKQFSARYHKEPARGYGGAMHSLLPTLASADWQDASKALFGGYGSYGNGAAMRGAPIGAYFAGDMEAVMENARLAAQVTHFHEEGVAGGIAVAVAAALVAEADGKIEPIDFLSQVSSHLPVSEVRRRTESLLTLDETTTGEDVAKLVGSGAAVAAWDTVPFCLWCAARFPNNYEAAIWLTLSGLGDRDTTCAIVGGIVAAGVGMKGIPNEWLAGREALDI